MSGFVRIPSSYKICPDENLSICFGANEISCSQKFESYEKNIKISSSLCVGVFGGFNRAIPDPLGILR